MTSIKKINFFFSYKFLRHKEIEKSSSWHFNKWMNDTKMLANDDDFISFSLSSFIASFQALFTYRNVYKMKFDTYALLFEKHKSGFKSWLNLSLKRESILTKRDEMSGWGWKGLMNEMKWSHNCWLLNWDKTLSASKKPQKELSFTALTRISFSSRFH